MMSERMKRIIHQIGEGRFRDRAILSDVEWLVDEVERLEAALNVSRELRDLDASVIERLKRAEPIIAERDRQDEKWGLQNRTLPTWITILMEEVGELAAAVLCHRFGNDEHPELDWKKEAIQVAAVALSITEQYRAAESKGTTDA